MICAAIPNNNYTIPCPDVTEMPDFEMTIDAICTRGGDNDQDGFQDFMFIRYQDGDIYFPDLDNDNPAFVCNDLVPILAELLPALIDCADPLQLWKRAENFLLNPLAELIDSEICNPVTTSTPADTTTTTTAATTTTTATSSTSAAIATALFCLSLRRSNCSSYMWWNC